MGDLLLELFSEEIPARMQVDALDKLRYLLSRSLYDAGFKDADPQDWLTGFVTPRRLTIWIKNLPLVQADTLTELKGPKVGAPDAAIQGFLKKSGMKLEQLQQRDGIYVAKIEQKGKPTAEVLKVAIEKILAEFPWPKSMRWGNGETTWVRPLHNILCIFDGKVVPVEFAGLKANNKTYGHRFLSPGEIIIKSANEYESTLEKAQVIADRSKRKAKIWEQVESVAKGKNLTPKADEGPLEEVTGLVEYPVVLMGSIDQRYMDLPPEVLVSEMRGHQKYFALHDAQGALAPHFLITSNMATADKGAAIIKGNERVLRARFADGKFFWEQDRKKKLEEWAKGLSQVTYHAKLGTVADKVTRVKALAVALADKIGADKKLVERAATLCKADLTTGMVGEFPELQGVMGRYYALHQGEKAEVADAIRDHYKPQGPNDSVPSSLVSICVALADKLDTLISMFAIGEKPTGSKDPFALRRAALGVIRIILENGLKLKLKDFVSDELLLFFYERLIVQLKDQDVRHDVIKAVCAKGDDDLVRITELAKGVQDFLSAVEFGNLLTAYQRAANIVSAEEKKDKKKYNAAPSEKLLSMKEEKDLHAALCKLLPEIETAIAKEHFTEAMKAAASLRVPIDAFFDKVLVNDKDAQVRENRLNLLAQFRAALDKIADFGQVEGELPTAQKKAANA